MILMQDDFTGTTIDTAKWTVSNPLSRITQNGDLRIAAPHTGPETSSLISIVSATSGVVASQCNLTWTTDSANEADMGIYIYFAANSYARIFSRANGGDYRIQIMQVGVVRYDNYSTGITKGKDVKITYDFATYQIKCWYWNTGTSAWVQFGTTQTWDLGATARSAIIGNDNAGWTGANPGIFENAFVSDADYATQYPAAGIALPVIMNQYRQRRI